MAGRPKGSINKYKVRRPYQLPGRYEERIQNLYAKKQKLEMLEALLWCHERAASPNIKEIKSIRKRANEVRSQLAVLSTVDPMDKPTL